MRIRFIFGLIISLIILTGFSCSPQKTEEQLSVNSFAQLKSFFADPPVEYRSAPLWVWNDEINEEEIDKQLTEMQAGGIDGVFIHPRPGLIAPYLSDHWFSMCKYTVDKARERGMKVWLYDENSYPSGFAGGHVPAEMPESFNQGQGLVVNRSNVIPVDSKNKYFLVLKKEASGFIDITDRADREKTEDGDYYLFQLVSYRQSGWFGGYSYVDLLLEGVTEKFIEVTMKGYEKAIGSEFGKLVPGIFTDEPNISPPVRKDCIRWTPSLFSKFRERWGYDLKTDLPSLYDETGDWKRVRHNYYALLLELFIERWSKPWHRYCEENNLEWTGHYWEHGWPSPNHGGDNMAMYAYHHVPAIDILMNEYEEDVHAQFGNVRAVKELISAANQMGRSRTLSETYGAGGWDLRFEDMKRIADWEYVLGVNFMNQHLSYVTIKGARKRDHPQSFSYHEPWWKFYKIQGDYIARLSLALASGRQVNRILVLEPTSSAWMYASPSQSHERLEIIGKSFQDFTLQLEKYQIEYDLGSENIIKDHGRISNGKFIVGKREYDIVVFPPGIENLDLPTAALVEQYLEEGGKILSFVDAPKFLEGSESDKICSLAAQRADQWTKVNSISEQTALDLLTSENFQVIKPEAVSGKLFHHRRQLADGEILFLVNTSMEERSSGTVTMNGKSVFELSAVNGVISPYVSEVSGDAVEISFDLPPVGSLLLFVSYSPSQEPAAHGKKESEKIVTSSGGLEITRIAPNTLTLDYCDLKLNGKVEKDLYFFQAADKIYKHHGLEGNPWSMAVQYKTDILDKDNFPSNSGFEASFPFSVDDSADKSSLQAVVERPGLWKVSINGKTVEPRPDEWWLDRAFGIFDIGSHVVGGINYVTLTASPMTIHSELESIYILGDFGLEAMDKGWKIIPLPSSLTIGEWKDQNMPFYADGVSYRKSYNLSTGNTHYKVKLGKWLGSAAEVKVNNRHAGIIGWHPYELDITEMVNDGENVIAVVVYGTLKNLLGPHHNNPAHGRAWPRMFHDAPEYQPSGNMYDVIGYGLFEDFTVIQCE